MTEGLVPVLVGLTDPGNPDSPGSSRRQERYWSYTVFRDYLKLAKVIEAAEVADIVSYLDREHCDKVCAWLGERIGNRRRVQEVSATQGTSQLPAGGFVAIYACWGS